METTTNGTDDSSRKIIVAGAQLGPIHLDSTRSSTRDRMLKLMEEAHSKSVKVLVFPELAMVTFFPRHLITNPEDLEAFFEKAVDEDITKAPGLKPIFDRAREYGMDVSVGFAEHDTYMPESEHVHYNTAVYYSAAKNAVISKYRKVHLPGTVEPYERKDATNQLEKRYFRPGNLGFQAFRAPGLVKDPLTKASGMQENGTSTLGRGDPIVGIMICNDRRWPEAWRSYGLQGVEMVLCGYNTTGWAPELLGSNPKIKTKQMAKDEALFHNRLSIQHGSYTNSCWSINVAKCGMEDGKYPLIGGSCIIDPDGAIAVATKTEDDELFVAEIDLTWCRRGKDKMFAFERHRRTEHYGILVEQTGVIEPDFL
jgi:predicted amidohydrolase